MHIDMGADVKLRQSVWGQMSTRIICQRGANVRGEHVLHTTENASCIQHSHYLNLCDCYYENLPMQYTENFLALKIENF